MSAPVPFCVLAPQLQSSTEHPRGVFFLVALKFEEPPAPIISTHINGKAEFFNELVIFFRDLSIAGLAK